MSDDFERYQAIAGLIIMLLKLAAQEGPEIYEAIKDFIAKLSQSDYSEEQLEALRIIKKPEDFFTDPA